MKSVGEILKEMIRRGYRPGQYLSALLLFLILVKPINAKTVSVSYTIESPYVITHSKAVSKVSPTPQKALDTAHRGSVAVPTGGSEWVISLIKKYFGHEWKVAYSVARCESGLRPNAIGDGAIAYVQDGVEYGKSYGIFQIRHLPGRPDPVNLLNAEFNVQYAYNLYKRSGFFPWSAYNSGCYKTFLAEL